MGDQYGPMIVAAKPLSGDLQSALRGKTIAIPGRLTTAFLTLQLLLGKEPDAFNAVLVPFDQIPQHVATGQSDAGLLIHEGQLTYAAAGLHLWADLGQWWHTQTALPLPLGGNCIRKDLGQPVMQEVTDILKRSIQYSLDHRAQAVQYALLFGRDLDATLADRFVGMYVNHWTLDYGPVGRKAITTLLSKAAEAGLVPPIPEIEYVEAK